MSMTWLFQERDSLLRQVEAVRNHHSPRETEVYSHAHHDADHMVEDERCSDACFEPFTICNGCGAHWPCSTIRVMQEAK